MATVCITGSTGFIGQHLAQTLGSFTEHKLMLPVRDIQSCGTAGDITVFADLSDITEDYFAKNSCDVVIHLAARAHVTSEYLTDPLQEFRKVNCHLTLDLARKAAAAGVKRFIFLSSIGVNGISNLKPFKVTDKPAPVESYAVSKLEAEIGLLEVAKSTGMEFVIIRPPLVYGPKAPGNFGKLTALVKSGIPLPLGAVNNKRSMVSLGNLTNLITTCIDAPQAGNQTFLVSDDYDLSTTTLLRMMAKATGQSLLLLPVPVSLLKIAARVVGKQGMIDRLCGNLQIDIEHTKNTLNWRPIVTVQEAINQCFSKD
ncbi:NAD-dependent epimerase/dehydratase family protein [Rheinheimera tangshanensis]|uniref:NAD-dependent epimerase/dehydratase family protein n=1 Tax=Rheinheimera tangshanensis TaxID=400153 RepID=A0A5C8LWP4_9GAMM|nr:NAD-dependent epimerase/dehydratase family protein [Rheinheimera tangshanensis]TXK80503.1 NAD-dependent epimerase/dehydratase family protein [Rheinheimera tangshanensis]GGM60794.1 UDP-glucose 4-epimerase [Rheinheimera tangshanensis]